MTAVMVQNLTGAPRRPSPARPSRQDLRSRAPLACSQAARPEAACASPPAHAAHYPGRQRPRHP